MVPREKALARAKNPYAFGLIENGYWLGAPKSAGGCRSGLAVEWLGSQLLAGTQPDEMSYTPDAALAVNLGLGDEEAVGVITHQLQGAAQEAVGGVGQVELVHRFIKAGVRVGIGAEAHPQAL